MLIYIKLWRPQDTPTREAINITEDHKWPSLDHAPVLASAPLAGLWPGQVWTRAHYSNPDWHGARIRRPTRSACRAPAVLLILRTFLLPEPLFSDPPNFLSFWNSGPPNPPSLGGGLPLSVPHPWPRFCWLRLDSVVSRDLFCWLFWFWGPTSYQSKFIQKHSKTSKNLTWCPQSGRFGSFVVLLLASIFFTFHNSWRTHILQHV